MATTTRRLVILLAIGLVQYVRAQEPQIPCGLPPFVDRMPSLQGQQLRKVWQSYQPGAECREQQARTFDIVGSLSQQEKDAIFGSPPAQQQQQQQPHIQKAGQEEDAPSTGPAFIHLMTPTERQQFDGIWMNPELEDAQKHSQLEQFARSHFRQPQQLSSFQSWIADIRRQKESVESRVRSLSPRARQFFQRVVDLRKQEQDLFKQMGPQVLHELHGII